MKDSMREIPGYQRPYEKCLREGEGALSDSELLAVILRCGTTGSSSLTLANMILKATEGTAYPGLLGLLHMSAAELQRIRGVGKVKAIQLKCIGELSKRMAAAAARPGISFAQPVTIAKYYMEKLRHEEQELLYCMMLDNRNHLMGEQLLSRGTASGTMITPREVFVEALRHRAVALILVHNHPSGDPTPSQCDLDVTQRIWQSGEMIGIHLLDHIIIGDHRYISLMEQGILVYPDEP
ncbi:MAG: DNA repair protein RadC [Clostridiales bacterium]|nr:DNA repair protein RadC [Clostridiales bacterium]